jgi:uncharacterized protein with ATP-grasp and redox domains
MVPIPEPITSEQPDTFAHHTVTSRLPAIARRTLDENDFPSITEAAFQSLIQEIPHAHIRPLADTLAPDVQAWTAYVAPYLDQTWLQVPWFFAETYFYRRILEATGYFLPGPGLAADPFRHQKRQGLEVAGEAIHSLSEQLAQWLGRPGWREEILQALFAIDLWGNQADLSLWPAGDESQPNHAQGGQGDAHILVNDAGDVTGYLAGLAAAIRIDFVVDNAGFELVGDLCLADYLLSAGTASQVHLHLKAHPTFVSDAMPVDVRHTMDTLAADDHSATRSLGQRLIAHLHAGRLRLQEDFFWTSPLPMWELPGHLRRELGDAHLVITKGDANYRRLLGDRQWPLTTALSTVVAGFPAPLLALRTLKSELAAGLPPEQIPRLNQQDPGWLTNGRWGVIQFVPG